MVILQYTNFKIVPTYQTTLYAIHMADQYIIKWMRIEKLKIKYIGLVTADDCLIANITLLMLVRSAL